MSNRALAVRPAQSIVGVAAGAGLASCVARDQARAIINAAETMTQRLPLEALWQTGGRVSEVLRLRSADVDQVESALVLDNLKQRRRELRRKKTCGSPDLVAQLRALQRDARIPLGGFHFRSRPSGDEPMSRQRCWRPMERCSRLVGVELPGRAGAIGPAMDLHFRHDVAVHRLRSGLALTAVQKDLGHARIETTTIYTQLSDADRRRLADKVQW